MASQAPSNSASNEHAIDLFIGNLLRVCVIATVVVVVAGALLFLPSALQSIPVYSHFIGEPDSFRSVSGIFGAALHGDGRAIVQCGLLLLILTPILRVAVSVFAFLFEKDFLYVGLTVIVLCLLLYSLLG